MATLRKTPGFRKIPEGITLAQAKALIEVPAPAPAPAATPPRPKTVRALPRGMARPEVPLRAPGEPAPRLLCAGLGCDHIPMHDTPVGRLCGTCHDRYRGRSDPGVRHIGGLLPFQGARPPAGTSSPVCILPPR